MKLVKEHIISEKFDEYSDPIADMNIGMIHEIKKWLKSIQHDYINKNYALMLCAYYGKTDFVKYLLDIGADPNDFNGHCLRWAKRFDYKDIIRMINNYNAKENKPKKLKESLNEKFTDNDSDPIHDMDIGIKSLIKKWLEKHEISNYIINNDLTIDVNDNVMFSSTKLNENLPDYIQFGTVTGEFFINKCNLTTLRGCPKIVKNTFYCSFNKLQDLKYSPEYVGFNFFCTDMKTLTNLNWNTKYIYWSFYCANTNLSKKDLDYVKYNVLDINNNGNINNI